jgi:hypothetical protein
MNGGSTEMVPELAVLHVSIVNTKLFRNTDSKAQKIIQSLAEFRVLLSMLFSGYEVVGSVPLP